MPSAANQPSVGRQRSDDLAIDLLVVLDAPAGGSLADGMLGRCDRFVARGAAATKVAIVAPP